MKKKIVYIAHPIGGDVKKNIKSVLEIVKQININQADILPFAPYIVDVLSLDDSILEQRFIGFSNNETLFRSGIITEVWLYGGFISAGMQIEIDWANELGILIRQIW